MNLEQRIKEQFPALMVTLLSVLIGLAFSDLVGLARTQMTLWPLDIATLRTWGQIFAMAACALSVWVIFAHIAVSRMHIPSLSDSLIVFVIPLAILFGNSLVGRAEIWPWLYFASFYLLVSAVIWRWQIHLALEDSELAPFAVLTRPLGPLSVLYVGIPFYAAAGWADSHGLFSPLAETLIAWTPSPAAILTGWIFVREWQRAVAEASAG